MVLIRQSAGAAADSWVCILHLPRTPALCLLESHGDASLPCSLQLMSRQRARGIASPPTVAVQAVLAQRVMAGAHHLCLVLLRRGRACLLPCLNSPRVTPLPELKAIFSTVSLTIIESKTEASSR